ncbi:MAG: AtpZ/AtpI family protein [Beijerinckiaceae bacterium]
MATSGDEKSNRKTSDDADLRARLDKLAQALEAQRRAARVAGADDSADLASQSTGRAMSLGFRVLTEFVVAIVVGTLIGWQLDVWLATGPIFLIVFLALGTAAGFLGVYRIAMAPTSSKGDHR